MSNNVEPVEVCRSHVEVCRSLLKNVEVRRKMSKSIKIRYPLKNVEVRSHVEVRRKMLKFVEVLSKNVEECRKMLRSLPRGGGTFLIILTQI